MKCKSHPAVDAVANCAGCSTPLCGVCADFSGDEVYCERCIVNNARSEFVEAQSKPKDDLGRMMTEKQPVVHSKKKASIEERLERREKLSMAIVIISCIFIGITLFTSLGAGYVLTPQEVQTEVREISQASDCALVFWEIAEILENGEEPDSSMICPGAQLPNIITRENGDIVVSHAMPQVIGYSQIYVSKNNPVPTMVRL